MKRPNSVKALEALGRVRLSPNFFMRDFLYSEIANHYGMPNIPDDPELAIEVGTRLCVELLEPLHARFGRLAIRSAFRSCTINALGNARGHNCANYGAHIWDRVDARGKKGAMACVVAPRFTDFLANGGDWRAMAWWIHDHLPYAVLYFYPSLGAFNISWHEEPERRIDSYIEPRGTLTKAGMTNHDGSHAGEYSRLLAFCGARAPASLA